MLKKLQELSINITNLIKNDDFTNKIKPLYLKNAVEKYPMQGGKRVRVALLLWSCGLLGGQVDEADYHAAAIEIWHNWTLVHDDIIDQDTTRRGEPSTHLALAENMRNIFQLKEPLAMQHGANFAILCGDLQQSWSNSMILKGQKKYNLDPNLTLDILAKLQKLAAVELISGEAIDIELSLRDISEIKSSEVIQMIDLKTSALFRCACEIGGALAIGTFEDERIKLLSEFATSLGLAFQLQDDLLDTFGDFKKLGKDIGSDIREKKPTLLLLKTLENSSPDNRRIIFAIFNQKEINDRDLELVKSIMINSGAANFIRHQIEFHIARAEGVLEKFPQNQYKDDLIQLVNLLVNRQS